MFTYIYIWYVSYIYIYIHIYIFPHASMIWPQSVVTRPCPVDPSKCLHELRVDEARLRWVRATFFVGPASLMDQPEMDIDLENHRKTIGTWWFIGIYIGIYHGWLVVWWYLMGFNGMIICFFFHYIAGWWWLEHDFYFSIYWEESVQLTFIFFRGV